MKRSHLIAVAIFLVFSFLAMPGFADEQSVAGKTYFGRFTTSCGEVATSCVEFDEQGNILWDQDLNGLEVFTGTYSELAFGPLSLWSATLDDTSPDGLLTLAGLAFFPRFTVMLLRNEDVLCPDETPLTAVGFYRRMECTPGQRN